MTLNINNNKYLLLEWFDRREPLNFLRTPAPLIPKIQKYIISTLAPEFQINHFLPRQTRRRHRDVVCRWWGTQDGFRYSDHVVPEWRFHALEARAAHAEVRLQSVSWTNLPVKSTMGFNLPNAGRLIRNINVCRAWSNPLWHGSCVIPCDLLNYAAAESHYVLIIPRNYGVLKRRPWTRFNYFSREQPELLMFQKID